MIWKPAPPAPSTLGDREVLPRGSHLHGRRVALLVCGGIAALKTPLLARELRRQGADVTAYASAEALRYVAVEALEWSTNRPVITHLSPQAEHLSDAAPFDVYLLPQATYNTINKIAHGIADGVVTTTLASALGRLERGQAAVLLVPSMHGSMHNSILTASLAQLAGMGVQIVAPRDADFKHKIPAESVLVAAVCRAASRSPLCGQSLLISGGAMAIARDAASWIVPRGLPGLGITLSEELFLRGADVLLLQGREAAPPPEFLPHQRVDSLDDYRRALSAALSNSNFAAAVLAATLPEVAPATLRSHALGGEGTASGELESLPDEEIAAWLAEQYPHLPLVDCVVAPLEEEAVLALAREKLTRSLAVLAASNIPSPDEDALPPIWLLTDGKPPQRLVGAERAAVVLADHLAAVLSPRAW